MKQHWMSRGLAALGGALALAAVGPAAANAQGGPPPPVTLTSGHLDWGLKQSFRNYIKGPIAHGSYVASDGASVNADDTFRFTFVSGTYDVVTHGVTSQFDGTVRFTGHDSGTGPLLDLTISDPKIVTTGTAGTLYLDARSKSLSTGQYEDFDDVAFATLDLTASVMTPGNQQVSIAPIASVLTADGAAAFAGFYSAGTALDPASMTVSYAPVTPPPTQQDPVPVVETTPEPSVQASPPPVEAATARLTTLARPYSRKGKVAVARLVCRNDYLCAFDTPERISFEAGGKRFSAAVIAPERLLPGKRGSIRIQLGKRALAALAGDAASATLEFAVRSGGKTSTQTLDLTLRRSGVTVG